MNDICRAAFSTLVINPRGTLVPCCAAIPKYFNIEIDEVECLETFYNEDKHFEDIRTTFAFGNWKKLPECYNCSANTDNNIKSVKDVYDQHYILPSFNVELDNWYGNLKRSIRFLEYTCSNICNQSCTTCSSFFSSKWQNIEHKFNRESLSIRKLSDKNIEKIIKVLPELEVLLIKGGEPFADKNNFKILNELLDCNKKCKVNIVSNMQEIPESALKILEKGKEQIRIIASIDGVGEIYNWIRGGDFDKTVKTIEKYYVITGNTVDITVTISIYNIFVLDSIVKYFENNPAVEYIDVVNVVSDPKWCSIFNLSNIEEVLKDQIEKIKKYPYCTYALDISGENLYNQPVFDNIEIMNKIRGFDLCDHIPELKKLRDEG